MLVITIPDFWAGVLAVVGLQVLFLVLVALWLTVRGQR
jgi:hypothetical protein